MTVYLDLNVFDRLEKLNTLKGFDKQNYQMLSDLLTTNRLVAPYSNAHLNDLFRGFQKNPDFVDGHLKSIQSFTKDLCICQYWGEKSIKWHYRDILEFFEEKKTEWEFEPTSYSSIFQDEPLLKYTTEIYKFMSLPPEFKQGYKDPLFGVMFPQAKIHNTYYSLHEDLFNFHIRLKSDYGFYKSFKIYLISGLNKLRNNKELAKAIKLNSGDLPKHLELVDIFDVYTPENKASGNTMHSKVIDTFFKYDLSGYKSDGHFNNMFDDALHTLYAAHCDFFITNDDRCKYKAEKTFERLKISTKVIKADEINTLLSSF